jgi:hypothetical protein
VSSDEHLDAVPGDASWQADRRIPRRLVGDTLDLTQLRLLSTDISVVVAVAFVAV